MSMEPVKRKEIWAVASERIMRFFRKESGVTESEEGFLFGSCRISVEPMEDRMLGSLSFPQTAVAFEGDPDDIEKIYGRFYMTFVSAGG